MVHIEVVKNKKTQETLKTKTGVELVELTFEVGDTFIPLYNKVMVTSNEFTNDKGMKEVIDSYKIKCRVKDKEGNPVTYNGTDELFVTLTPTQYKAFEKKKSEDAEFEPNQNLWIAYEYKNQRGTWVGIAVKSNYKVAKNFEDFN